MSNKARILYSYFILTILYAIGTLTLPPVKGTLQKYHISLLHLRLLDLTIIIPFALIWYCGAFGFYKLFQYSDLIEKNKDGKSIKKITYGIGLLAFWLPVTSVINLFTNYAIQRLPGASSPILIFQNYLTLIIPLLGFILVSLGTRGLTELAKQRPTVLGINIMVIIVTIVGVIYVHLVSTTNNRLNSVYHLSVSYLLITLVAPYIYMWFLGILSVYEIYIYRLKVKGVIYRKSWRLLAAGLGSIIVVSMLIQYLTTISEKFDKLSLSGILLIVYGLLVVLAVSYVLIALGVNNLKRIEEV